MTRFSLPPTSVAALLSVTALVLARPGDGVGVAAAQPLEPAPVAQPVEPPPAPEQPIAPETSGAPVGQPTTARELLDLLPIELTAFGDFLRRFSQPGPDAFEVGPVELDVALSLAHNVMVSTGFVYDPEADVVRVGSFTVDGGLFGEAESHLFASTWVEKSGLIFGKFDVPFGIAYLKYPAPQNRFVLLPAPVLLVHDAWNDVGVQAYVIAEAFNVALYWLNGTGLPVDDTGSAGSNAAGGRLGLRPWPSLELGGSTAWQRFPGAPDQWLYGGDLAITTPGLELSGEYLARDSSASGPLLHGFYAQGIAQWSRVFADARYEMSFEGDQATERTLSGGLGIEVLPEAELRLVHAYAIDGETHTTLLQVVGGSAWQPTGLRR